MINRTNRLVKNAMATAAFDADDVVASVFIYCAGCLSAIRDQSDELLESFTKASNSPFIAGFTLGEVGCVLPLLYGHGNIMVGTRFLSNAEQTI